MEEKIEKPESVMKQLEVKIQQATGYPNMSLIMSTVAGYTKAIPDSVSTLDAPTARELAAKFLKGQSLCGDLVAIAEQYEGKMAQRKKQVYAEAFFEAMTSQNLKTAKDRECYADKHPDYAAAVDEYLQAIMFKTLIENKRKDLEKAHYFLRKIAESDRMDPLDPSYGSNPDGNTGRRVGW